MSDDVQSREREMAFRKRLAELGLTLAEFRRRSGLTRNIVYRLSKGGKPSMEQAAKMDAVLRKE